MADKDGKELEALKTGMDQLMSIDSSGFSSRQFIMAMFILLSGKGFLFYLVWMGTADSVLMAAIGMVSAGETAVSGFWAYRDTKTKTKKMEEARLAMGSNGNGNSNG